MSIHEFHAKLMSVSEECGLLGTLRKLSLIEDPKAMLSDDDTVSNDWIIWGEASGSPSQRLAVVEA
jgi:hypothetical protein